MKELSPCHFGATSIMPISSSAQMLWSIADRLRVIVRLERAKRICGIWSWLPSQS